MKFLQDVGFVDMNGVQRLQVCLEVQTTRGGKQFIKIFENLEQGNAFTRVKSIKFKTLVCRF